MAIDYKPRLFGAVGYADFIISNALELTEYSSPELSMTARKLHEIEFRHAVKNQGEFIHIIIGDVRLFYFDSDVLPRYVHSSCYL